MPDRLTLKIAGEPSQFADEIRELLLDGIEFDLNVLEVEQYSGGKIFSAIVLTIWNAPAKVEELRKVLAKLILRPVEAEWGDLKIKVADRMDLDAVLAALKDAKAFEQSLKLPQPKDHNTEKPEKE